MERGEVASRWMSNDQNPMTSASNLLALSSGTKPHAQHMLTGSTDEHGEKVIDSLCVEAFGIECSQGG